MWGGVVLNSCTKDPDQIPEREQDYNNAIDTRSNANLLADSIWQKPSVSRLNLLWAQMMEEATVDEIGTFIYNNGLFDWKLAKVVKEFEPEHYILSVPTLKHDTLQSILFVAVNNGAYSFFHITKDQLQADTEVLLEQFGPGNLIIPIFSFFQYSQVLGSRRAFDFLYTHLTHPEVADQILEIIPRGWCLIEIELYTENQSHEDVDENCNCTYVNQLTGHEIMNPPSGVHPSVFDPTWYNSAIQQHKWRINYLNDDGTVIHGSPGESGTTVYHFWAWCEDEVGQDPWAHSWVTNLEPTGGGGGPINTGPDWSYNKPRWNENTMECMFAFNHPHATAEINQLEEALLTASCGEAAEYNVKSIIDNIVMGLCNEYYDNQEAQGGEFPQFPVSTPHDIHETLEAITLGVESSSYYQIGQDICDVCDNALNSGQCYEAVNNCGTEGYEVCVEEALCSYSLQAFRAAYNLSLPLDDACTDHPEVVQFLLEHQESAQFSEEEIDAMLEDEQLFYKIHDFINSNNLEYESSVFEAVGIYIHLAANEDGFKEWENEFDAATSWWLPFVKEIAKEALLELLRRRVQGSIAGLPQDMIQAIDAIAEGDILEILGEALDIGKRFFPALQAVDATLDGIELFGKGTKAWRAISKLQNFGDEVIEKVISTIKDRTGKLLGNFNWKNNSTGIEVFGISNTDAGTFFNDLINKFSGATLGNPTHPNNTLYDIPGDIKFEFQPTSNTSNSSTISIKKGSYIIKLRLLP